MAIIMRLILIIVTLAVASGLSAQTFGIKGGLNLSYMEVKYESSPMRSHIVSEYSMKSGFNAGLTVELPVKDKFSIDLGCLISTKGYSLKSKNTFAQRLGFTGESTAFVNYIYLDIPMTARAYISSGTAKFYGAFGPYIGIGLGVKSSIINKTGFENLNRLDCGLIAEAGIVIYSCQLSLSYGHGLVNISTDNDEILKNRVLGISLGYRFGGS